MRRLLGISSESETLNISSVGPDKEPLVGRRASLKPNLSHQNCRLRRSCALPCGRQPASWDLTWIWPPFFLHI